jgi:UTP--glucose-1-phosphate uridylyltransferase
MTTQPIRKAIIPAAGLGTRFLPVTKAVPKEMLPIVDTPTIQLVVDEACRSGVQQVIVINGRYKTAIEEHFDHAVEIESALRQRGKLDLLALCERPVQMVELISLRQKRPLGLGHAVLCARHVVGDEPFAVLLGDDLIDNDERPGIGQLIEAYRSTGCGAVALMEVPPGQEHLYGIAEVEPRSDGYLQIRRLVEKPAPGTAPTRLAVVGRYVLSPAIWPILDRVRPGVGGEIQLTDALSQLAQQDLGHDRKGGLVGVLVQGTRHDAGERVGYLRANLAYALKRPELRDAVRAMLREFLD